MYVDGSGVGCRLRFILYYSLPPVCVVCAPCAPMLGSYCSQGLAEVSVLEGLVEDEACGLTQIGMSKNE